MTSFTSVQDLPLLTAGLPGSGGRTRDQDDFVVEEVPAYLPCGEGQHVFALIEKRGLTTRQAIDEICRALALDLRGVGYAGLKDKHAVTRQWISFDQADPDQLLTISSERLRVLEAARHINKLRTGHLKGNRFQLVLRDVSCEFAEHRAREILSVISKQGLPNYYGTQRFGVRGDNAQFGLRILRGEVSPPSDRGRRRLIISALQSQLFNEVVARRLKDKCLSTVLDGDLLARTSGSAPFVSSEPVVDQNRLDEGEIALLGPICGPRMPRSPEGSQARALEDDVLNGFDLGPEDFRTFGRLARGGRRRLSVPVGEPKLDRREDGSLDLRFCLPAGSYATVLLREITKLDVGAGTVGERSGESS